MRLDFKNRIHLSKMKEAGRVGWILLRILLLRKLSMARKMRVRSSKTERNIEDTKENTISDRYPLWNSLSPVGLAEHTEEVAERTFMISC